MYVLIFWKTTLKNSEKNCILSNVFVFTAVGQQVGKGQSFPLNAVQIIQQPASGSGGRHLTYSLQQFMQQNKGSGMIITSQPIITTVTQSQQPQGQMVTKVLGSSAVPTTHLQTLSATLSL